MKILSGIQPSGQLHIGNYFGMMLPMIRNMEKGDLYAFIVNLHALTTVHDREKLALGTLEAAADFIALGLDPEKCIFWVQGDVPEVTELTWILSTITAMGLLERCHSYKDKIAKGIAPSHGLFSYPVLMAADIKTGRIRNNTWKLPGISACASTMFLGRHLSFQNRP
jgi:tryptophanyl-tRNA synthetase